jgi:hypothetical protein
MTELTKKNPDNRDLTVLAVLLALGIVVFELWMATTDHDNSRSQHLGGAVAYAKGHIDLLRPMLLGFNANGSPTPLEFPIWQALTAVLMKCFGIWYGWGNVVSLLFYFSSIAALFSLCRRLNSDRAAWWAVVFTLLQPLTILAGGRAGGDSTAWGFAMWFIYFSYRMINDGGLWWPAAILTGCLSAITKAPFFMAAGLTAFFWLWLRQKSSIRAWLFLSSAGIISVLACLAWNFHCQKIYAEAEFPTIDLDPYHAGGAAVNHWYFGSLAYRLNIHNWMRGGWHMMALVFGSLSFILFILLSVRLKRSTEAWLFLLAAGCTTLVFTPLLLEHDHYFFIVAPPVAWLCALSAAEFEFEIWNRLRASTVARVAILLVVFAASLAETYMAIHFNINFDNYQETIGRTIEQHTASTDKIIVWGLNWGDPFLRSNRDGLTGGLALDESGWLNNPDNLQRLRQLGYDRIALVNPSPFIVALTSVTGKHGEKLVDLHEHLPAVARNWPVVFDSTQLLILKIPETTGR